MQSPLTNPPARQERLLRGLESAALFLLGVVLMNYFYAASAPAPGAEIGAPEYDSFYHIRMSSLLLEEGILTKFPWLRYVYFRDEGDDFVSHHFGFHVLLSPFVYAAKLTGGDALAGGRWAMSAVFGANLALFGALLRAGQVRFRWAWIALLLLLPDQFFSRHGYVRAIGPSLMLLQLLLLMLLQRRWVWAAVTLAGYVQLYLGAVMFGPLLVAIHAAAMLVGPRGEREPPWKMIAICFAGWCIGVAAYPYSGIVEFLRLQVFGSGLSPDIAVGREWLPYTSPWFLFEMSALLLFVWTLALCARLRFGPRLSAAETTLLVVQFGFLLLTLKARRFIEYWPLFCLLSAAFLASGPLSALADWWRARSARLRPVWRELPLPLVGAALCAIFAWQSRSADAGRLLAEWRALIPVVALLALAPFVRIWLGAQRDDGVPAAFARVYIVPGFGVALVVLLLGAALLGLGGSHPAVARLHAPTALWAGIAAAYFVAPAFVSSVARGSRVVSPVIASVRSAGVLLTTLGLSMFVVGRGAPAYADVAAALRCHYDLPRLREVMADLKARSQPGDVVFTDDWDVFPAFFYHNTHNHYIVGLDPKFTHQRRPDLWERFVKITRAETPGVIQVTRREPGRAPALERLDVRLSDIRSEFAAQYVITDRDHADLAAALARDPALAELVFPAGGYASNSRAPYLLFRIRGADEVASATPPTPDRAGQLPLSALRPAQVLQGWGDLRFDRSVDGNYMRMYGRMYRRGLGSHAPAQIVFDVPSGASSFRATIGVDDETRGRGSVVVSVLVDNVIVYESPVLRGNLPPVEIDVPVSGGRQLSLHADTTPDGQASDHVDWAEAAFWFPPTAVDSPESRAAQASQP